MNPFIFINVETPGAAQIMRDTAIRRRLMAEFIDLEGHVFQLLQPDPLTEAIQGWYRSFRRALENRNLVSEEQVLQEYINILRNNILMDPLAERFIDLNTTHVAAAAMIRWLRLHEVPLPEPAPMPPLRNRANRQERLRLIMEEQARRDHDAEAQRQAEMDAFVRNVVDEINPLRDERRAQQREQIQNIAQEWRRQGDNLAEQVEQQERRQQETLQRLEREIQNLRADNVRLHAEIEETRGTLNAVDIELRLLAVQLNELKVDIAKSKQNWLGSLASAVGVAVACWGASAILAQIGTGSSSVTAAITPTASGGAKFGVTALW